MKKYFVLASLFFILASLLAGMNEMSLLTDGVVLREDVGEDLHFFDQTSAIVRYGEVNLNQLFTIRNGVKTGDTIRLNLFADAEFYATVIKHSVDVNGTVTIVGAIDGYEYANFISTTNNNRSLVNIVIPQLDRHYRIISDERTLQHYLIEMTRSQIEKKRSLPPLSPDTINRNSGKVRRGTETDYYRPDDPAVIDIMIAYTPAAQNWANTNGGGINNVIGQALAFSDITLDNSDVLISVILAHSSLVHYTESQGGNDSSTDLIHFANPVSGQMDEIHSWRDNYGADLVVILTLAHDTAGLGFLLSDRFGSPDMAFTLSAVQYAGMDHTVIHELGHNMGAQHHAYQNTQPGPTEWINWPENTWSAGWLWEGNDDNLYCCVMTYEWADEFDFIDDWETIQTVYVFSNPNVVHQGVPVGHAEYGDNARTLREMKHVIASYRTAGELAPPENFYVSSGNSIVSMFWDAPSGQQEDLFEGFEGSFPPTGWAVLSPDGGSGWTQLAAGTSPIPGWGGGEAIAAPDGGDYMAFCTWSTGGQNHNDQWLVSPQIGVGHNTELSFHLRYTPTDYDDYVEIRLSTESQTNTNNFTIVVDQLSFNAGSSTNWQTYSYDLAEFVDPGTSVYIAFREYVSDNFNSGAAIFLDNVHVGSPANRDRGCQARSLIGYNVYRNGSQINSTTITNREFYDTNVINGTTYTYYVTALYDNGESIPSNTSTATPSQDADVDEDGHLQPLTSLSQNYPNPFNPVTTVEFSLKEEAEVKIEIYNILGQKVKSLLNEELAAGKHSVVWRGEDDGGQDVASGVYFYRMTTDSSEYTRKMILLK